MRNDELKDKLNLLVNIAMNYDGDIKEIKGCEEYFACEQGEILSLHRKYKDSYFHEGSLDGDKKYKKFKLRYKDGTVQNQSVHRIIYDTFIGIEEDKQIHHKDGITGEHINNALSNLEQLTPAEHRAKHKKMKEEAEKDGE